MGHTSRAAEHRFGFAKPAMRLDSIGAQVGRVTVMCDMRDEIEGMLEGEGLAEP